MPPNSHHKSNSNIESGGANGATPEHEALLTSSTDDDAAVASGIPQTPQIHISEPPPEYEDSSVQRQPGSSPPRRPGHIKRHSSLSKPSSNGEPRTPRTVNRVRFEIEEGDEDNISPRTVPRAANGHVRGGEGYSPRSPGRSWVDDADYLSDTESTSGRSSGQRERLLEEHEAPSVSMAMEGEYGEWGPGGPEEARAKSGMRSAFMNMANSIIGAGIIGQPYAFRQAGLLAGTALLIGLTITVDWTIRLIVVNSKLSGANSFQSTMEFCFGKAGLIAISIAQWVFAFGGMVAFCVIVGDTIPHVLVAIFPSLPKMSGLWILSDRRFIIVLFVLGVSFPLSLYRDIAKLAKASTLALLSMLIIIITVITQGFSVDPELKGKLKGSLGIKPGIFQAIGVISFAFVCHHNSLLIYGSLQKPTMDRFARVTHYSTSISMFACLAMALSGFLTFGDKTLGNVLNNFPSSNVLVNIARLCFGLNMLTTLPLEAFVCREVMLLYFHPEEPHKTSRHLVYTTGLVVVATGISLTTCDLGAVFELIGATSACALAYIFPPLCYIKLSTRSWRTYVAWAVVLFGVGVLVISSGQSVAKLVKGGGGTQQCH